MAAAGSRSTLFAALAANAGIAVAKFCGAAFTGSSAMASEGVHSLVDTGNQILLLFGMKDASRPADAPHPFGYGLRLYFWGFVVALAVFALGSGITILEGIEKVAHPTPIDHAWVNVIILLVSIALEGYSLSVAIKEVAQDARRSRKGLMETLRTHRDPTGTIVCEAGHFSQKAERNVHPVGHVVAHRGNMHALGRHGFGEGGQSHETLAMTKWPSEGKNSCPNFRRRINLRIASPQARHSGNTTVPSRFGHDSHCTSAN